MAETILPVYSTGSDGSDTLIGGVVVSNGEIIALISQFDEADTNFNGDVTFNEWALDFMFGSGAWTRSMFLAEATSTVLNDIASPTGIVNPDEFRPLQNATFISAFRESIDQFLVEPYVDFLVGLVAGPVLDEIVEGISGNRAVQFILTKAGEKLLSEFNSTALETLTGGNDVYNSLVIEYERTDGSFVSTLQGEVDIDSNSSFATFTQSGELNTSVTTHREGNFSGGINLSALGGAGYDTLEITGAPFSNREVHFSGQFGEPATRVTSYSSFDDLRAFAEYEGPDKFVVTWFENGSVRSSVRIEGIEEFRLNGSDYNDDLLVLTGSKGQAFGNGNRDGGDALWADWSSIDTGITWDLTTNNDEIKTLADGLQVQGIERLLLQLGDGDDVITALGKDDEIRAGGGNDTVTGAGGNDEIDGGNGNGDVAVFSSLRS